ncbi:CHASE domain-containing protein [Pseudoalteromonas sp. MMG010]|uniref:CHASE domain-containing protein n=1 Tax=Pseudoalteromonas sp. MMG010 TaxID=2822685 RepID=UPI001B3A7A8F|nr:ATP-binding protein [Pseudoalteromonas sp. MMG010]MBQ4834107.1 CHASE domain-containing protein [Pseudoalteromonas sp. MMG010]
MKKHILLTLCLSCSYFITGFSSIELLAIDGYAVASWPPSGIALGGMLLWGRHAILGVLIGAFVTNFLHLEAAADIFYWPTFFQALGVALAATLQAWLGAYLIINVIKSPLNLSSLKHSIQSLLVAGPLCCVISALVGSCLLVANNVIPIEAAFDNFFAWWIGDSIGVLIFTTLMLAAFKYKKMRHRVQVIIPSLVIYLIISVSFYGVSSIKKEKDLQKKEAKALNAHVNVINKIKEIQTHLALLTSFFESSEGVSYQEFKQFTATQLNYSKEIIAFEWVPYITAQGLNDIKQLQGIEEPNKFYVKEKNTSGDWQAVTKRDFYFPVYYVHPLEGNENALGFDLASNLTRRDALLKAKSLNELVLSEPITLVQKMGEVGVLFLRPVFRRSPAGREFKGFTVAVVSANKLANFLRLNENTNITVSIYDVTDSDHTRTIYKTSTEGKTHLKSDKLSLGKRVWKIELYEPLTQVSWFIFWIAQIAGMLFVWLLITFLISVTSTNIRIREQVAKQTHNLRLEKQKSDQASKIKSQFLANMSHEVRTPINGIKGLHYLALQQNNWQQAKHYIEQADGALSVLLRVLNDVLDFSKMEAGKLDLIQEPINLTHLMTEVSSLTQFEIDIKSLSFDIKNDTQPGTLIDTDPIRLKQILLNLLNNAIKFTNTGSITLKVWQEDKMTWFSVADTGIGIDKKVQNKLFQPFSQEDSSTSRQFGGTGLGLSICKKLVELMGGTIEVTSRKGEGATFTFSIPMDSPLPPAEFAGIPHQDIDISNISFAQYKVLLVEDNPLNQHVASAILKTKQCVPDIASDGAEAIKKLTTENYDAVLMDIQMPNMDGLQATKVIRNELGFTDLIIIGLSANAHDEDIDKALACGMNCYITKPIEANILFKTLWSYLSEEKQTYDR